MDILVNLTADYDLMRDMVRDLEITENQFGKVAIINDLAELSKATALAEAAALYMLDPHHDVMETAKSHVSKMFDRSDLIGKLSAKARDVSSRTSEANSELLREMVMNRIADSEKEMLPEIAEVCTEAEREEMGEEYARFRDIALGLGQGMTKKNLKSWLMPMVGVAG